MLLAEFDVLKAEIKHRVDVQFRLIFFNFGVVGAAAALIYSRGSGAPSLLLYLVPPVSVCFGLLWVENTVIEILISRYIRKQLWPRAQALLGIALPSWEDFWVAHYRGPLADLLGILPPLLAFLIPGVSTLFIAAWNNHSDASGRALLAADLAPILAASILAMKAGLRARRIKYGRD